MMTLEIQRTMWVVRLPGNFMDVFIKKVVSYRRNKVKTVIIKDMGHYYMAEKTARKAAEAFGGTVEWA